MSLETISEKRDRIYQRKFDHDEARRLHAAGESYAALARRYGVTLAAIRRICDPLVAARMASATQDYTRRKRRPCAGGCGRLVWTHGEINKRRTGYCWKCLKRLRDANRTDVRPAELRCSKCGAWKLDDQFPTWKPVAARRGRNSQCRTCVSATRRAYRHRHPLSAVQENTRTRIKRGAGKVKRYVVLSPNGDNDYREVARVDAVSPTHAIEQSASTQGRYIAIPVSRFAIMAVEPVQAFKVVSSAVEGDSERRRNGEAEQATRGAEAS